ncbi:glycoside hydrolase family 130 protein [Blastomonas sp. CACIA14H2]|uniref:glycoside hydrolase family 130 protein n=1 Tax=Blastomonas sp. CACIA14H2 TaxID=1419876 RepID=UPI00041BC1B5
MHIHDQRLSADPSRVVLRPFHLSWHARQAEDNRALKLVDAIATLTEEEVDLEYGKVLADFRDRHWQTEAMFAERWAEVQAVLNLDKARFSPVRQKLIGAYFCHEYAYAAAALMNPSIVPHPDQTGCEGGAVRFIMSLRAVGEGHISSIAFREGIALPSGQIDLWPQSSWATSVELDNTSLTDSDSAVAVHRNVDSSLSNTVIFPVTEQQRNGLEDLRLVRFQHDDGQYEWIGTYTAYSGSTIRSELLRTIDFRRFILEPIEGEAGRNKGMALFPEKIGGQFAMIGRQDGKNLFLLQSPQLDRWEGEGQLIMEPRYPWEFIQIGNCGSPIRTPHGWLLLTHGVGAMRKYALGCALLDLENPSRVIARTIEPLLTAENADRSGYVPNVIYTCGAMRIGNQLIIPYGISDSSVGFANIAIADLLKTMG